MSGTVAGIVAAIAVTGQVQFWERTCDAAGACSLPTALSVKIPVNGTIEAPAGPGRLGYYATDVANGDLRLKFELFWKGEDAQGVPYLAVQANVQQVNGEAVRPLAQCNTFYGLPDTGVFFLAGVCGGFVPSATGYTELGVTFYK